MCCAHEAQMITALITIFVYNTPTTCAQHGLSAYVNVRHKTFLASYKSWYSSLTVPNAVKNILTQQRQILTLKFKVQNQFQSKVLRMIYLTLHFEQNYYVKEPEFKEKKLCVTLHNFRGNADWEKYGIYNTCIITKFLRSSYAPHK